MDRSSESFASMHAFNFRFSNFTSVPSPALLACLGLFTSCSSVAAELSLWRRGRTDEAVSDDTTGHAESGEPRPSPSPLDITDSQIDLGVILGLLVC